jgi:hypothetical protein
MSCATRSGDALPTAAAGAITSAPLKASCGTWPVFFFCEQLPEQHQRRTRRPRLLDDARQFEFACHPLRRRAHGRCHQGGVDLYAEHAKKRPMVCPQ